MSEPLDYDGGGTPQDPNQEVQQYHSHYIQSSQSVARRNLVGLEGMPPARPPPLGPKAKFTVGDDRLLIELKEEQGLEWKDCEQFFPGRTWNTLRLRYAAKLKKRSGWTEENVSIPNT